MTRLARVFAPAALLAVAALSAPAAAQGTVTATYGDWNIVCDSSGEECAMRQVGKGPQGNDVLAVTVRALDGVTADDGSAVPAVIDIIAPLGVALRAGVRVTIDGGEERGAPFEVCTQQGCLVRQPMGTDFLEAMKRGVTARMLVVSAQRGEVPVDISLSGFTRSFGELESR